MKSQAIESNDQAQHIDLEVPVKPAHGAKISRRRAGFVNHNAMILVALIGLILAVVLPQLLRHGWRRTIS